MSWDAYVSDNLVASGHVDKAAIYSKAGDSVWATSKGFDISPEEMKTIILTLDNKNDSAWTDGIHIAGERYVLTANDEGTICGRKGKEGFVATRSTQALFIAHHSEEMLVGNTRNVVEKLSAYLKGVGY